QVLLSAGRWKLLLEAQGANIPLFPAIRLTFIGCMFSTIIPGTVGGDVLKLFYLRSYYDDAAAGIVSLAADRITGLLALLLLGAGPAAMILLTHSGSATLTSLCWAVLLTGFA